MIELLLVVCLITTTVLTTLFVVSFKERAAEHKARTEFKADFAKTAASIVETNNKNAEHLKNALDRISAIEMRSMTGAKK